MLSTWRFWSLWKLAKVVFEHIKLHLTYSCCSLPNDCCLMVVAEEKPKLFCGGSLCCIYSAWLGQWQVNHEQLTKNLAVIWGVLMWTFRPIWHCRPTLQFLLWKLWCLRCILLYLKWLLHSTNASGIRLCSLHCWSSVSRGRGLLAGNGSCIGTRLLMVKNNSHGTTAGRWQQMPLSWVCEPDRHVPTELYEALNDYCQLIRMSK